MKSSRHSLSKEGPTPRQEIDDMNPYTAPLEGRRELLRLDFNENTIGPSPLVIEALKNIPPNHIAIYPEYNGLHEAIVKSLGKVKLKAPLNKKNIGLFNGVDAAIHSIFHSYGDRNELLLTTTPTFGYYTPCAHMQGMDICAVPYEGKEFNFPLQAIRHSLLQLQPKLLFICNPNNPTGTKLEPQKILELAALSTNTLIVIDELYEAFEGSSVLPIIDYMTTPNVVVLRSLSKTAGLAGLRIGFAIGNPNIIDRILRVTGPYDINSFAVTAAFAALKDQAYIDSYVKEVLQARDWIQTQLVLSKTRHHIAGGNYLLIWPSIKPLELEKALRREGILVRNMDGKPLINGSLRVSIGTKAHMQQFWKAFTRCENISF